MSETVSCVSCGAGMQEKSMGMFSFMECPSCEATWMNEASLLALWNEAKPNLAADSLNVEDDGTDKRPCPVCGEAMDIAWLNLIQVDRCAEHGIWLDPGELDAAAIGHGQADEARDDDAEAQRRKEAQRAALLKLLRDASKTDA